MKIRYCFLFVFIMSSALMAVDVNWSGPITFTPAAPAVGDNVIIKARFTVMNGSVQNLMLTGTIDGNTVYSKIYPSITGPKTMIVTVNWTAAHSTKIMRQQGQPSNVKVEFRFSSKIPVTTNTDTIETTIPVKDAPPALGIGQNVSQKKPDFTLAPCYANADGTTDLVPVEFSFKYIKFGKFSYTVSIKNTGPRCLKILRYKITYPLNDVDTTFAEHSFPDKPDGWVIYADETRTIHGTFDRHTIPYQAFQTSIDSEVQEISFSIGGLKLVVDPLMEVVETNEANNVIETGLHWVED
jgi:hypothetical protein